MSKKEAKQYVYIAQSLFESAICKIDLAYDVKSLNTKQGSPKERKYRIIFSCEVKNAGKVDYDTRKEFWDYKIPDDQEDTFFLNDYWFEEYVAFIKSHPFFVEEVFKMKNPWTTEVLKKTTLSSENKESEQMTLY